MTALPPLPSRRRLLRALAACALLAPLAACGDGADRIPLSSVLPPTIRVHLGETAETVAIGVPDAWEAVSTAGRPWRAEGSNLSGLASVGAAGIVLQGAATGADTIRIHPASAFTVQLGGERLAYRGDLLIHRKGQRLVIVNEVDLETYVAGVIVNEIGDAQAPAAYRAQSVVARSYAYSRWRTGPDAMFHVYDTQNSQVYRGVSLPARAVVTYGDLEKRTAETRGVVLTWRGEPFPTYYASTCGGHTTQPATAGLDPGGATEPLAGVSCSYCTTSKYFTWTETVSVAKLLDALKPRGVVPPLKAIEYTKVGPGGWVGEVTVTFGTGRTKVVPGTDFRTAAGLRSMNVELPTPMADGTLVFRGKGWGHGVGMCQVGCQEMARKGYVADQILRYYYPGAEFTRLY